MRILGSGKLFIPYLDCGNYFGQDPDQWLIDEGINAELGWEIVEIKKPSFANNSDFSVGFNESFDYVVAQSVFSHTDEELTRKGLKSLVCSMTEEGLAMVTIKEGVDYAGNEKWVYPGSTTYSPNKIADMLGDSGCYWRRLWWFHPAQTWFVLTKSKQRLPGVLDSFFLLGGEEVGSKQYDRQGFISNRIFSLMKKHELTKKLFK